MSGCRSTFLAPSIGSKTHYERIKNEYNLKTPMPEDLYSHFDIFKEISDRQPKDKKWRSCILYFSQPWLDKIMNDESWVNIKTYLLGLCVRQFEPDHYKSLLESVFSYLLISKNQRPNPYIIDTARHIISTATGVSPGFAPADNTSLPANLIQDAFINFYGLKKYFPTIFQPSHFIFEKGSKPVYYSMQYPSTHNFSPKSRTASSVFVELRELSMLLDIFIEYLADPSSPCSGTILESMAKNVSLTCMHSQKDKNNTIKHSSFALEIDDRLSSNLEHENLPGQKFSSDGKFFRGCVAIYKS